MESTVYWIWLQLALEAGSSRADHVLQRYQNAENFYRYGRAELSTLPFLNSEMRERILAAKISDAEWIFEETQKFGGWFLTPDMPGFPAKLRNIFSIPCVLYGKGKLPDLDSQLAIGMVGTRNCDEYGRERAYHIAAELSRAGVCVVSGLALGIDGASHEGALAGGSPTVAVLGCGLDTYYPPTNRELQQKIERFGTVITEYPLGTKPVGSNFPVRNRLIAGLSNGLVIVQSKEKSGSLITAGYALEQGKDLFVVPSNVNTVFGQSALKLLREGAIPVGSARDILEEYGEQFVSVSMKQELESHTEKQKKKENASVKAPVRESMNLTEKQHLVYDTLKDSGKSADEISSLSTLELADVMRTLTGLEMLGLIKALPGGIYSRVS